MDFKKYCSKDNYVWKVSRGHFFRNRRRNPEKKSIHVALETAKEAGYKFVCSKEVKGVGRCYGIYRGPKNFLASHKQLTVNRHLYEVLPADLPRFFYADLDRALHKGDTVDTVGVVKAFRKQVQQVYAEVFGKEYDDSEVTVWSASSAEKLSYHLRFPFAFRGNSDCRRFATLLNTACYANAKLYWYEGSIRKSVFDPIPYQTNQTFRLPEQSKLGSPRILKWKEGDTDPFIGIYKTGVTYEEFSSAPAEPVKKRSRSKGKANKEPKARDCGCWDLFALLKPAEKRIEPNFSGDDISCFLSCIPNSPPQAYPVWIGVGMALKNEGRSVKEWIAWTNQGYTTNQKELCRQQWAGFQKVKKGYRAGTLKRLAERYVPQIDNGRISALLHQVLALEPEGFEVDRYEQRYVKPYDFKKLKALVECSAMGTGKTWATREWLREHKVARVLILSPRIIFSRNIEGAFAEFGFENYKDHSKTARLDQDRLICSIESLHKVNTEKPFDLVIADEIETLLHTFSSGTVSDKDTAYSVFEKILKEAGKVLMLDAFVSNRTLEFLRLLKLNLQTLVRVNSYVPELRAVFNLSKTALNSKLKFLLGQGRRIVYVAMSQRHASTLREEVKELGVKTAYYDRDTDDAKKKAMIDANAEWTDIQLLIYTPTITVGVNYDLPEGFDYLFLYASNQGALVRDAIQATMRVRVIKSNTMYFYNCSVVSETLPVTRSIVERQLALKAYQVQAETGDILEPTNPTLLYLLQFAELEKNLSYTYYPQMLEAYLKKCNYAVQATPLACAGQDKGVNADYESVADLTPLEFKRLREKMLANDASEEDKQAIKKHQMKLMLDKELEHDMLKFFWDGVFCNRTSVAKLKRMRRELQDKHCCSLHADIHESGVAEATSGIDLAQRDVQRLCGLLGLESSTDRKTQIPQSVLEAKAGEVSRLVEEVKRYLPLSDQKEKATNKDRKRQEQAIEVKNLTNSVLRRWSGSALTVAGSKRVGSRGKQKRQRIFQLKLGAEFDQLEGEVGAYFREE